MRSVVIAGLLVGAAGTATAQANWTVVQKPLVEIGVVEGKPEHEPFELDVEFIRLSALKSVAVNQNYVTPAAAHPYPAPPTAPQIAPEILFPLRAYLRATAGQQEMFYSKNSPYTSDITQLPPPEDKNIVVHILNASDRGWAGSRCTGMVMSSAEWRWAPCHSAGPAVRRSAARSPACADRSLAAPPCPGLESVDERTLPIRHTRCARRPDAR